MTLPFCALNIRHSELEQNAIGEKSCLTVMHTECRSIGVKIVEILMKEYAKREVPLCSFVFKPQRTYLSVGLLQLVYTALVKVRLR